MEGKRRSLGLGLYNIKGLLGIRRIDKVMNARIRQLCGVVKSVDEKVDEGVL